MFCHFMNLYICLTCFTKIKLNINISLYTTTKTSDFENSNLEPEHLLALLVNIYLHCVKILGA